VAQANAERLRQGGAPMAPLSFRHGADLSPLMHGSEGHEKARVIVSNPPYIAYD